MRFNAYATAAWLAVGSAVTRLSRRRRYRRGIRSLLGPLMQIVYISKFSYHGKLNGHELDYLTTRVWTRDPPGVSLHCSEASNATLVVSMSSNPRCGLRCSGLDSALGAFFLKMLGRAVGRKFPVAERVVRVSQGLRCGRDSSVARGRLRPDRSGQGFSSAGAVTVLEPLDPTGSTGARVTTASLSCC